MKPNRSILISLLRLGGNLHPIETVIAYLLPIGYICCLEDASFKELLYWNTICQLCIFLAIVQLPLAITGKMSYVDIGWPLGLIVLGFNGFLLGHGATIRRYSVCICIILHGGRMLCGALYLFFPYDFKEGDLSRYQYAKYKWVHMDKMPQEYWSIKSQLDTLTQCYANSVILAAPILLAASNPVSTIGAAEVLGLLVWLISWIFENIADSQKVAFIRDCKRKANSTTDPLEKQRIKLSVLGYEPFNSSKYWLWTKSRHPNYFFEWMSWIGFAIIGFANIWTIDRWLDGGASLLSTAVLSISMILMVRFFYDCLVYWTGAAPAEQESLKKRPLYGDYQRSTRVFFPFPLPCGLVSHHMVPGWPSNNDAQDRNTNKIK